MLDAKREDAQQNKDNEAEEYSEAEQKREAH